MTETVLVQLREEFSIFISSVSIFYSHHLRHHHLLQRLRLKLEQNNKRRESGIRVDNNEEI